MEMEVGMEIRTGVEIREVCHVCGNESLARIMAHKGV